MLYIKESFQAFISGCVFRRKATIMHSGFWCGYGVLVGDEVRRCNRSVKCPRIARNIKESPTVRSKLPAQQRT